MTNKILLLDTNILYNIMEFYSSGPNPSGLARKIKTLIQENQGGIFLPDIVQTEFSISLFQKHISYYEYPVWYKNILSSYMHVYRELHQNRISVYKTCQYAHQTSVDFIDLAYKFSYLRVQQDFIDEIILTITDRIQNAQSQKEPDFATQEFIERNKKNLKKGKLLDGMDALILASAIVFAMAHPETPVILVSDDRWMARAARHLLDNARSYGLRELVGKPFSLQILNPWNL